MSTKVRLSFTKDEVFMLQRALIMSIEISSSSLLTEKSDFMKEFTKEFITEKKTLLAKIS